MAGSTAATILTAAGGDIFSAIATHEAGVNQEIAATVTAGNIEQTAELNAELIEQGSELNAGVHDFNAAALEGQAKDAISQGKVQETLFRQQLRGVIGSQRASYAAQGVELGAGTVEQVSEDTAYQGELDALQIRTNAARSAWGFTVQAEGETLQAQSTRQLGTLQAANVRAVGKANANAALITGQNQSSAANWGAASTLVTGGANLAIKYGFGN